MEGMSNPTESGSKKNAQDKTAQWSNQHPVQKVHPRFSRQIVYENTD